MARSPLFPVPAARSARTTTNTRWRFASSAPRASCSWTTTGSWYGSTEKGATRSAWISSPAPVPTSATGPRTRSSTSPPASRRATVHPASSQRSPRRSCRPRTPAGPAASSKHAHAKDVRRMSADRELLDEEGRQRRDRWLSLFVHRPDAAAEVEPEPELAAILEHYEEFWNERIAPFFAELYATSGLEPKTVELIATALLALRGWETGVRAHTSLALRSGATPA